MSQTSTLQPSKKVTATLFICALYGLIASFALTYEKLRFLSDPNTTPICNLNPILTCASAISSGQVELFGIPHSLFGIAAYSALLTLIVLLLTGYKMPKIIGLLALGAAAGGIFFMHYLLIQSIFFLGVICPWCFGIWMSVPLIFFTIVHTFAKQNYPTPHWLQKTLTVLTKNTSSILLVWYVVVFGAIITTFWEFWRTLLP